MKSHIVEYIWPLTALLIFVFLHRYLLYCITFLTSQLYWLIVILYNYFLTHTSVSRRSLNKSSAKVSESTLHDGQITWGFRCIPEVKIIANCMYGTILVTRFSCIPTRCIPTSSRVAGFQKAHHCMPNRRMHLSNYYSISYHSYDSFIESTQSKD